MALAKLLEHGVTHNDARLQGIIVQGDQVGAGQGWARKGRVVLGIFIQGVAQVEIQT